MQFSLKTLLLVTLYCAVLAGAVFAAPRSLSFCLLLMIATVTPGVFVVAIIYGRSYVRAFGIGGIVPAAILAVVAVGNWMDDLMRGLSRLSLNVDYVYVELRTWVIAAWVAIVVGGLASMLMLWHLKAGEESEKK